MSRFTFLALTTALLLGNNVSNANKNIEPLGEFPNLPVIMDSSASPDAYGYTWKDNDNGAPVIFNWVDITTIGTRVQGLGDDNNVGPFNLGWNFMYYWYPVDHLWIGSNGFCSFSSSYNFAHPFGSIPSTRQPNDLLAVLAGDLDFTNVVANPSCYYYTNNVDTFIVSWIHVPEFWSPPALNLNDSTHTFQVILSGRDSSVTFQYGENHGNLADVIGIENVVGRVGLQYLCNNSPASQLWHNGLAIKFHAVRNPNFYFSDFGVVDVLHPGSKGDFVKLNVPYSIMALVENFGTGVEDSLTVNCKVRKLGSNTVIYDHTDSITSLNSLEQAWVEFSPPFVPDSLKTYKVTITSGMPRDGNASNNTKMAGLYAFSLPSELKYDDGVAENGRSWNDDFSGFGNEFQMPVPVLLTSASFYVNDATAAGDGIIWIVRDNDNGLPDLQNTLYSDTVNVEAGFMGWKTIDLIGQNLNFQPNQKFYVFGIHANHSTFRFGMDQSASNPLSHRGWEYAGSLAPDRMRDSVNIMIKVYGEPGSQPGFVGGVVTDQSSNPIPGVIDSLFSDVFGFVGVDTTDENGRFSFTTNPGNHSMKLNRKCFRDTTITGIVIYPDQTTTVDVMMNNSFGAVMGLVTDLSSNPIADVIDSLFLDSNDSLIAIDTTDVNGRYLFPNLYRDYKIKYCMADYKDTTVTGISISSCQTVIIDVQMVFQANCHYLPGDINSDNTLNNLDVVYAVNYFKGGHPPFYSCQCSSGSTWFVAGDVNGTCTFTGLDVTYLVRYFKGGTAPIVCPVCPPAEIHKLLIKAPSPVMNIISRTGNLK
jgi:hypothetical protein